MEHPHITSLAIPRATVVSSGSLFSCKYAVGARQVYEIHFALVTSTVPEAVKRRYSEFHKFRHLVQTKEKTLAAVAFPKKQIVRSCAQRVVEVRRKMLEEWLTQVSRRESLRPLLLDFLCVGSRVEEPKAREPSRSEAIISTAVMRLRTQPKMRLATLESFEKEFFETAEAANGDYLLAFVQKLVPLCGDNYLGCKAISILSKLVSRESTRSSSEVLQTLRSLPLLTLKEMHLEKHLLKSMKVDTGEESFHLTKLLSQDDPSKIEALVRRIQLNDDSEAVDLYTRWVSDTLDRPITRTQSLGMWRDIDCSDCKGLSIAFRPTLEGVEMRTKMVVNCDLEHAIRLIADIRQRKKWDFRIKDALPLTTSDAKVTAVQLLFEAPGKPECCIVTCDLRRIDMDTAVFTLADTNKSAMKLHSVYTLTQLKPAETSPQESEASSCELETSFALSDTEVSFGREACLYRCEIVNEIFADTILSRAFASDIIGEANTIKRSWQQLRGLAEGTVSEFSEGESDMSSAVERKSLVGRTKLRSFRNSNSQRSDSLSLSQRLTCRAHRRY